ncbi:hypothetical protein GQ600_13186 [Phytophthora cactorum]|nr:hypothetical protein GQ600_13186 [Phytophthora cactorum]
MTDHQFLPSLDFDGFLATQDAPRVDSPKLHHLENQQLLADTDSLLQSLYSATSPTANTGRSRKTAREIAKMKADQRRDAYRQRVKVERATLRHQEAELSRRLALLKKRRIEQKSPAILKTSQVRREAETLHKALRAEVTRRSVTIQDIQCVMQKRVGGAHKEVDELLEATESRSRTKDETLFNVYFASLDTLYAKLDEVFEEAGINSTPESTRILGEEPTRKMDGETHYLENVGVTRCLSTTRGRVTQCGNCCLRSIGKMNGTTTMVYPTQRTQRPCSIAPLSDRKTEGCSVRRRTRSHDGSVVIVWRALSEAEEEFPGLNMDETGWCVIHAPSSDSNCSADSTRHLCRPAFVSRRCLITNTRGKLDQFMELSVKTVAEDNLEIEYMMERLLLDDALSTDGLVIDEEGNLALAES